MVRIDRIVDMLINLDASAASPPNFSAYIAVLAAAGMAVRITETCSTFPGKGNKLKIPYTRRGKIISRTAEPTYISFPRNN